MRVLGVDPGLTRCGVAIVESDRSRRVKLIAARVIRTDTAAELGQRLFALEQALVAMYDEFAPDAVAVERVFSQANVRTAMGTAQAAGIAALIAARQELPLTFHTPTEVKAAVTGSGRAGKEQVATMVSRITGQALSGPADLTDAVALAICHAWRGPIDQVMSTRAAMARANVLGASR